MIQCQTCDLTLDQAQVVQAGRCPRCGAPVPGSTFAPAPGGTGIHSQAAILGGPPPQKGWRTLQPPQPDFGPPPPQGFGEPPVRFAPGTTIPPPPTPEPGGLPVLGAPGVPVRPPPKKRRTGLILFLSVVLLVGFVGGVLAGLGFAGIGPLKSLKSGGSSGPPLGTYTSTGGNFSIGYPTGWQVEDVSSSIGGIGELFKGPANQRFLVANFGPAQEGYLQQLECAAGAGIRPTSPKIVGIGGQNWTEVECDLSDGYHEVNEVVIYQNVAYFIGYTSPEASFESNRSSYFSYMEASFQFLS